MQSLHRAQLHPAHLGALEMHGTGTPLGDPIECGAALAVLDREEDDRALCLAASKSYAGHAEPAAGAVGLNFLCTR